MSQEKKRAVVESARGALTWRQGELKGKDVWHVILYPYDKKVYHTTILGKKPLGASVVKGPHSAYETAQLLTGRQPNKKVAIDMGITDIQIAPSGKPRRIKINREG